MNQQQTSVPIPRNVATLYEQQRQIESLTAQLQQLQTKPASTATIDRATIEAYVDQYITANAHRFKGEAGKDGANGKDGVDGKDGKDGTDGKDGAIGKAGANGIHGTDGKPGKDGKQGPKGPQGKAGESFSVDKLSKKDIVALKKALGVEEEA